MSSAPFCLIGIGGAGGRVVARAAPGMADNVCVAAVNTDQVELAALGLDVTLPIGSTRTRGAGCGGATGTGRLAAEDDVSMLRDLLGTARMAVVVAGLGGGTGTGGLPTVLRAIRDVGAISIVFATLPFDFEGQVRRDVAQQALRGIQEAADIFILVPNERLFASVEADNLKATFELADGILGASVRAICNIVARPGYISLDFGAIQALANGCDGICTLGYAEATGRHREAHVLTSLFEGPMLDSGKLVSSAGALLVGIVAGADLTVKEVGGLMASITERAAKGCQISMGTTLDDSLQRQLIVVMFVAESLIELPDAADATAGGKRKAAKRTRRAKPSNGQRLLGLDLAPSGRGRFNNVEPTILDGENLDTPTFLRRGIQLDK
ncbi:MAG: hypothetical protein O3A51_06605 [Verrucomicrobia bacterium]|nr:hypothetical protein [Verrucomicrobiota bacterium]